MDNQYIRIAMADDHLVLRMALATLIDGFAGCKVVLQADNGQELINALLGGVETDLAIIDQQMPVLDGLQATRWIRKHKPGIRIMMLTMSNAELSLVKLLQFGVRGFLKKNAWPAEMETAINKIMRGEYYYPGYISPGAISMVLAHQTNDRRVQALQLTSREETFIRLCVTDAGYPEIARRMKMTARTMELMRLTVFEKLGVHTRVELAFVAMRNGLLDTEL